MAEMKLIVQRIEKIESHDNADRLEIAFTDTFDWPIIVGKGTFKPGDKVVHFPVDCIIDEKMEDILLGDSKIKLSKQRIRAAKIRGVISYGILCPWETIDNAYAVRETSKDLMKDLNCHKFEPPVALNKQMTSIGSKAKGKLSNSNFDKYMNMNHLQNCKGVFDPEDEVIITEKLHGTSFRAGWVKRDVKGFFGRTVHFFRKIFTKNADSEFVYGSRNVQLQNNQYGKSIYKKIVVKYNLRKVIPFDTVIYGEIVGPGIQKGYTYTVEPTLFIYDVKCAGTYVSYNERFNVAMSMNMGMVPALSATTFKDIDYEVFWKEGSIFPGTVIEGVVIETPNFRINRYGRMKCKVINPQYLLNKDNTDFH